MSSRISLVSALSLYAVLTSALPSAPPRLSENRDGLTLIGTSNTKIRIPSLAQPVECYDDSPPLTPSDCNFIVDEILLRAHGVFTKRPFIYQWYMREDGQYAPSRWRYDNCQISVQGYGEKGQMLSFSDVAFTAVNIFSECVSGVRNPIGGVSVVGTPDLEFVVMVQGYMASGSISAKEVRVSRETAEAVAGRAMRSPDSSEHTEVPQGVEIRDSTRETSSLSVVPVVASNFTLSPSAPPEYPIHCFKPFILVLPPAVATDCRRIIRDTILHLADPTQQLTFGFTDAADINLSKPEYREWQHGQCMISVINNNMAQMDEFRLIDVANNARRITWQCLVVAPEKIGGVTSVGTNGRGFYVYVGGLLDSSRLPTEVVSWLDSPGNGNS